MTVGKFWTATEIEAFETFQPTCFWDWARGYIGKANQFYLGTGPNDPHRVVVRLLNVQRSCNSLYKTYWIWPNVVMYLYIQLSKSERFYCRPEEYQNWPYFFSPVTYGSPKKSVCTLWYAINICKSIHIQVIQLNTKNIYSHAVSTTKPKYLTWLPIIFNNNNSFLKWF